MFYLLIDATKGLPKLQPLLISVDPKRDTPKVLKTYLQGNVVTCTCNILWSFIISCLKDFHPRIIGLTGSDEEIHQAAKGYRVYYSVGPTDDENDYLVRLQFV